MEAKKMNLEQMERIDGGRGYWSCNLGMTAVGVFWAGAAGIATGGIGSAVVGLGWGALTAHVCRGFE